MMKRQLMWIATGAGALCLTVPALAMARGGDGTPDDDGVPGDVRGNCDEAEHAGDPACLAIVVSSVPPPTSSVTTAPASSAPSVPGTAVTVPAMTVSTSTPGTTPTTAVPPSVSAPASTTPWRHRAERECAGLHDGRRERPL